MSHWRVTFRVRIQVTFVTRSQIIMNLCVLYSHSIHTMKNCLIQIHINVLLRLCIWGFWSLGAPKIDNMGDLKGILRMLAVIILRTQTTNNATTQLRHTNEKKLTREDNKNVLHCYLRRLLQKEYIEKNVDMALIVYKMVYEMVLQT